MCNTEISQVLLFFSHGRSTGKLKWFLFASHRVVWDGGGGLLLMKYSAV